MGPSVLDATALHMQTSCRVVSGATKVTIKDNVFASPVRHRSADQRAARVRDTPSV